MFKIGDTGHFLLDGVQVLAPFIDCALTVCHNYIAQPHGHQKADDGDPGSPGSRGDDLDLLQLLSHKLQRIDDARQGNHRRPVLVVMENRNIAALL